MTDMLPALIGVLLGVLYLGVLGYRQRPCDAEYEEDTPCYCRKRRGHRGEHECRCGDLF